MAGGNSYPKNPMALNFGDNHYTRAYLSLMDSIQLVGEDRGNSITYSDYKNGYCLFGFDLTPDCRDGAHWDLVNDGSTSVKIEFDKDTPASGIKVIVLAEFDNLISIDKNRNVFADFSV